MVSLSRYLSATWYPHGVPLGAKQHGHCRHNQHVVKEGETMSISNKSCLPQRVHMIYMCQLLRSLVYLSHPTTPIVAWHYRINCLHFPR